MKGLIGKKLGMTSLFDEEGKMVAVSVIQAGPCVVVEKKSREKDGYQAVQLGFGEVKEKKLTKPVAGQFEKKNIKPLGYLRELDWSELEKLEVGQQINVDIFKPGELVDIIGISKGKGFAGTMKRHNFSGGPESHGSMSHRRPASGGSTNAAHTMKGKKLPGRMGNHQVTSRALKVIQVDKNNHLILVSGSVPGPAKTLVLVRQSKKAAVGG